MSSNNAYGYGIWFIPNDTITQINTLHPTHITLVCNLKNIKDAYSIFYFIKNHIRRDLTYTITIYKEIKSLNNTTYSEHDLFTNCWGYFCEILYSKSIFDNVNTFMKKNNITGCISSSPHITMDYKTENTHYDLNTDITASFKLVIADIRDENPKRWKVF